MIKHENRLPGLDPAELKIRDLRLPQVLVDVALRLTVAGWQLNFEYGRLAEKRFVGEQPFRAGLHPQIRVITGSEEETENQTIRLKHQNRAECRSQLPAIYPQ